MSSNGYLQHHYVPVVLTHNQPGRTTDPNTSHASNLQKWQAFGLNRGVSNGSLSAGQSVASSSGAVKDDVVHVEENEEEEKKRAGCEDVGCIRLQLLALSSRVGQAKEEEFCRWPRQKGGTAEGKRCREGLSDTEERRQTTGSAPRNQSSAISDETHTAHRLQPGREQWEQEDPAQGKKRKRQVARKKVAHASTISRRVTQAPPQQVLFSLPADPMPVSLRNTLVAFQEVNDGTALFSSMLNALNDVHRIQAPTLFVAFILHTGETNFSISATTHGKVHFVRGVNPEMSHIRVQSFFFRWKDDVFAIPAAPALDLLARVVEELPGVEIVTFNAPSLLLLLLSYRQGRLYTSCISDVRIMSWMLQPPEGSDAFTDYDMLLQLHQQQICLPTGFRNTEGCTAKEVISHRVYYMAPLYRLLYGKLGTQGLLPAFLKQEKRISLLCASMKLNGFLVNLSEVEGFKARCVAMMDTFHVSARRLVPSMPDFNLQNLDECRVAIYEVLRLGTHLTNTAADGALSCHLKVTKSGKLSTSEETLKLLAPHHELPGILIAYRKAAKLLQTYTVGMMETAIPVVCDEGEFADRPISDEISKMGELGHKDAGKSIVTKEIFQSSGGSIGGLGDIKWVKLYPNFIQEGTDTGRLSCVEPNLQNLPRSKSGIGKNDTAPSYEMEMASFRRCLAVPSGWTLLSVDYEQIELRVLAHLCADSSLVNALTNATDIHRAIAETIFHKSPVTCEERSLAKRVVFGMLYGAGSRTLATQMDMEVEEALHVTSLFKASYPQIDHYHRRVIEKCRTDGFVRTFSGRLRFLPDINDHVMGKRSYAERQAFNTVIQGSAADVMKLGMLAVERDVLQQHGDDVRLLAQIHDEIILSLPTRKLREVVPAVAHSMTHAVSLLVPLRVTVKVGSSFGEMEEWSIDHELGILQPA